MVGAVPERVQRAVALLDLRGDAAVLEIGPGPGAAAELVLAWHPGVRYVAVDRSATAVARTTARNRAAVDDGRLVVRQGDVADPGLADTLGGPFDVAFAVNVNVFWTRSARAEAGALAALLVPGGALWLVYETPGDDDRVVDGVRASLAVPELGEAVVVHDGVVAVGARRPHDAPG
ncbi:SAM-dependent methyltransferase [Cellulosimicrobium protaetiae]|uniref:Class I SAM-dependent methyltransferase n=1 Tax=Cellulosimicrobium protaetiae TaxID=2587808 RepID=A0A6M5UJD7_9MICO|nr:class I SAM-dependent methyltransferase [Cellulosimicrobium protaetiae]QJW37393.1 class I SAM-dependent methyltransferase [Cellulosimicrobium protaetiae]